MDLFTTYPTNLIARRRERAFIVLAGLFLGTLGLINILGISRFIDLSIQIGSWNLPILLPIGVLPYPLTFLCTDIICEFYGKERANIVVWVGLLINFWVFFIIWLGGILPPYVTLDPSTQLPLIDHPDHAFYKIRLYSMGGIFSSMVAYLTAQLLDVYLFQFWKEFTKGKHLWLRTNGSTLVSQFIDTTIVISLASFLTGALPHHGNKTSFAELMTVIFSSYLFKMVVTLLGTIPFYIAVYSLRKYFSAEHKLFPRHLPDDSATVSSYSHGR